MFPFKKGTLITTFVFSLNIFFVFFQVNFFCCIFIMQWCSSQAINNVFEWRVWWKNCTEGSGNERATLFHQRPGSIICVMIIPNVRRMILMSWLTLTSSYSFRKQLIRCKKKMRLSAKTNNEEMHSYIRH